MLKRPVAWRRKGGSYFYKRDRGFQQLDRPFFLAVEDPQDVTNDLAKGSFAIQKVSTGPQLRSPSCHDYAVWSATGHTPPVVAVFCECQCKEKTVSAQVIICMASCT